MFTQHKACHIPRHDKAILIGFHVQKDALFVMPMATWRLPVVCYQDLCRKTRQPTACCTCHVLRGNCPQHRGCICGWEGVGLGGSHKKRPVKAPIFFRRFGLGKSSPHKNLLWV